MITFNFNKEAEILIYGYGKIGQELHHRLLIQGYRVVGIIDKKAEQFVPINNCVFIRPEDIDEQLINHVIVITFQNILEHERVVNILRGNGIKKIIYLKRSKPKLYQKSFKIYNQLVYGKIINDFEFPVTNIEFESDRSYFFKEDLESIIIEVSTLLLFTGLEPSVPWHNVNITACKEYNALYNVLLQGNGNTLKDFATYCNFLCGSNRNLELYLQDRLDLCRMMQVEYLNNGLSFFRSSPSAAKWNKQNRYFNLTDGLHRASFLVNNHVHNIPIRISKEDYESFINSTIAKKCIEFINKKHIKKTYTPIAHPWFSDIESSTQKVLGLTAKAMFNYFRNKEVNHMRVIDLNSNLSYFSQIFARMGAAQIISMEQNKELFELAKLLNQLYYIDSIEMRNDNTEEIRVQGSYSVVIMANDFFLDLSSGAAKKQLLKKIDSLSSNYFISRSYMDNNKERQFIFSNSSFKSYYRLNVEIVDGILNEIGIYEK